MYKDILTWQSHDNESHCFCNVEDAIPAGNILCIFSHSSTGGCKICIFLVKMYFIHVIFFLALCITDL